MIHTRQYTSALQLRDDGDGRTLHGALLPWGTEARELEDRPPLPQGGAVA